MSNTYERIETEALFHYRPGDRILSLGNFGCNLDCDYCQNWKYSQFQYTAPEHIRQYTSQEVIDLALKHKIKVLSWTYNDPAVWLEFVMDTAEKARQHGLLNLFKSAFFLTQEAVEELCKVIDVFAISIKAMDEDYYTYFEQRSATPNPVDGTVDVHLVPHYRRLRVIGADFATVLEGVGLRGEAAYTLTDSWNGADDRIDDPYLRAVMGLDHTWDLSAENQLFVIVQYALDVEVPRRGVPNQEALAELVRFRHFYRHALLVNAELRIGEFVRPGLKGMVNLEKGDFLIQPELSWQALDGLRVVVGADFLGGGRQTFFGQFDRNSRVRLRLEGKF